MMYRQKSSVIIICKKQLKISSQHAVYFFNKGGSVVETSGLLIRGLGVQASVLPDCNCWPLSGALYAICSRAAVSWLTLCCKWNCTVLICKCNVYISSSFAETYHLIISKTKFQSCLFLSEPHYTQ